MKNRAIEIIETYFTIIISLIASFIVYKNIGVFNPIIKFDIFISSIVTITITLIAALITAITILIAIINTKVITKINRSGLWNKLINNITYPIVFGFILLGYSLYIIVMSKSNNLIHRFDITVIVFIGSMFITGILKIGVLVLKIIKIMPAIEDESGNETAASSINEDEVIKHYKSMKK